MIKKIVLGIGVLFVGLQFFRGTPPEVTAENPDDLLATSQISSEVSSLFRTACYDCHSNETRYPWYSYITPVSWFVFDHISHGREEVNFSEWASLRKSKKVRILKDLAEEVGEGKMPLESYTIMHGDAQLTKEQRDLLVNWAESFSAEVMKE
ncbi:MAG: heme-binding domain-containing protein [Imperialibacter sp.]|uniref:heme-binding domain-containing protein n=1 Tax=Imperialibacter sp. TaxID=2038411 RepID=UPI0032F09B52